MMDKFIQTGHGRIHWLEAGDSGESLILLHSNGCSAHEFDSVIDSLRQQFRVFAWDMPGHGDSDPLHRHYRVEDYADALVEFMDAINVEQAWVVGASIGGLICVELASRYARRVKGVIVVESVLQSEAAWETIWPVVEAIFGNAEQAFEDVRPRFRELTPAVHKRWNIDRSKAGVHTMIDVMWAIREYDGIGRTSSITVPTAVLWGDKGPVTPTIPQWHAALPRSPIRMLHNCGHFPMIDDPVNFAAVLKESIQAMSVIKD